MNRTMTMATVFLLGGGLYATLEVLWRGYTHPSMAVVGGLALYFIYCVQTLPLALFYKMLLCGGGITLLEGASGVLLNLVFQLNVWDYSHLWGNVLGQVCIGFSLLWVVLSLPGLYLCRFLSRHIFL